MSVNLQPIFTQTVGSGGSGQITFNNIPQGYADLVLKISTRSSTSTLDSTYMSFNFDRSTLYSSVYLQSNGGTVSSGEIANSTVGLIGTIPPSTYTANVFTNDEVYIPNYTGGVWKSYYAEGIAENSSTSAFYMRTIGGLWRSSAPITRIDIYSAGANFAQNSTFTLYGVATTYDTQTPAAVTSPVVTDIGGALSVAFTPSANDAYYTAVDNYSVYDTTNLTTLAYGASSPVTVPNLTPGVTYNLAVKANNSVGSGTSSSFTGSTANNYGSIATFTVTNTSTTYVTFFNIPTNYQHLELRSVARSARAAGTDVSYVYLNLDGAAVYSEHILYQSNGTVVPGGYANQAGTEIIGINAATGTTNAFGASIVQFQEYNSTAKYKTYLSLSGYDNNGAGGNYIWGGSWFNQGPIHTIRIGQSSAFAVNSTFALYGIG